MVQTGAPDFQELTQWSDTEFFNAHSGGNNTGGVTVGIFNVSQWAYLQVNVFAAFVDCRLDFWFGSDPLVTSPLFQRRVFVSAASAQGQMITIPCSSLFVRVIVSTAAVQADAIQLALFPSNRPGPSFIPPIPANLIEQSATAIGIGATINLPFAYTYSGPVHLSAQTSLATGDIRLQWLDEAGVVHPFWIFSFPLAASGLSVSPLYIPPGIIQARVRNTTAGAGAFTLHVMPDAFRTDS